MKPSEFIANGNLDLYTLKGEPSASDKGAKLILIKNGEAIPEIFIPKFLRHNRNFIKNLKYENGIPVLTNEQKKKYGLAFEVKKKPMKIEKHEWTQENLTVQLNDLGKSKFKDWAELEFGEDSIDKRKSPKSIIVEILRLQEVGKR